MYALTDTYDFDRDRNYNCNHKVKMREERKKLKLCDRCEGFGILIVAEDEETC